MYRSMGAATKTKKIVLLNVKVLFDHKDSPLCAISLCCKKRGSCIFAVLVTFSNL